MFFTRLCRQKQYFYNYSQQRGTTGQQSPAKRITIMSPLARQPPCPFSFFTAAFFRCITSLLPPPNRCYTLHRRMAAFMFTFTFLQGLANNIITAFLPFIYTASSGLHTFIFVDIIHTMIIL